MSFGRKIVNSTTDAEIEGILRDAFADMSKKITRFVNSIPHDDLSIFIACMEMTCATLRSMNPQMVETIKRLKDVMECYAVPKME